MSVNKTTHCKHDEHAATPTQFTPILLSMMHHITPFMDFVHLLYFFRRLVLWLVSRAFLFRPFSTAYSQKDSLVNAYAILYIQKDRKWMQLVETMVEHLYWLKFGNLH